MKANYGLLPPIEDLNPKEKDKRKQRYADRSFAAIQDILSQV
jgi:folate-dependent tRNA-U54 methylase TrmFO/GidA